MRDFAFGLVATLGLGILSTPAFARDITDMTGRSVTVPDDIESVVTIGSVPVINSFVFAVGAGDRLAMGLPARFDHDRWGWQFVFAPQLGDGPELQDSNYAPDIEQILTVDPDVVLTFEQTTADLLADVGIPVIVLRIQTPDDVKEGVRLVGDLLGNAQIGQEYGAYFDETLARIAARIEPLPEDARPTALYLNPVTVTQPHKVAEWWLAAAGARSVTDYDGRDEEVLSLSTETVIGANPDYIVTFQPDHVAVLETDPVLSGLDAVANQRVLVTPMGAHTWGNRTVEQILTVLWAASAFHPDLFPHDELIAEVKEFYARFFATDLSDAQVEAILTSVGVAE